MSKLTLSLKVLALGLAVTACGSFQTKNDKRTISTDLPDDGSTGPVKMYWVQGGQIERGTCSSHLFVIKANCLNGIETMAYDDFKLKLDAGVTATVEALVKEIGAIENAIDSLELQRRETMAAIALTEAKLGMATGDLLAAKEELATLETFIAEYRAQLKAIRAKLNYGGNGDLLAQARQMAVELQALKDASSLIAARIPALFARVVQLSEKLSDLYERLNSIGIRLDNLRIDHARTWVALQWAIDDLDAYLETLAMLTDEGGINYRVHADNPWFQKVRRFVKRFEVIFASSAKKA